MHSPKIVLAALATLCFGVSSTGCSAHSPVPPPPATLTIAAQIEHLDTLVREPMVVQHQSGALFVAGYNRVRPGLWKSADNGATWTRVDVGTASQGAVGNSDVDLAIAPDGTLYFVSMGYDNKLREGTHVAIGVSRDVGATWRWTTVSRMRFDDRPWIDVAPDGTAHVVWNDGNGVNHSVSRDGGITWTRMARVHDRGGSSHLAVGPHGEIAVRITPGAASSNKCDEGTDLVAISADAGATWRKHAAPGSPRASGCGDDARAIPRWVDPIAWDAAGALHALWTTPAGVWVGRSQDQGATWTNARIADDADAYFPYLVARAEGELAATWFTGVDSTLRWRVARVNVRGTTSANTSAPMPIESMRGDPSRRDPGGEYLATALLRDGTIAVVTPIQHESAHRLGFTWWRFELR